MDCGCRLPQLEGYWALKLTETSEKSKPKKATWYFRTVDNIVKTIIIEGMTFHPDIPLEHLKRKIPNTHFKITKMTEEEYAARRIL
jgi:hypothetical protein